MQSVSNIARKCGQWHVLVSEIGFEGFWMAYSHFMPHLADTLLKQRTMHVISLIWTVVLLSNFVIVFPVISITLNFTMLLVFRFLQAIHDAFSGFGIKLIAIRTHLG